MLLYLIEKAEVDIQDIFVSEITAQYLDYVNQMTQLDIDTASEFISMAATLTYIKSRKLLPKPKQEPIEPEEDPEVLLIRQLYEYKAIKAAGEHLMQLEQKSRQSYLRLPEEVIPAPAEINMGNVCPDNLWQAFCGILASGKQTPLTDPLHEVEQDPYTVRGQLLYIRTMLQNRKKIYFTDFFDPGAGKTEKIVTFMAMLELLVRGEITVRQKELFAPIVICAKNLCMDADAADDIDE